MEVSSTITDKNIREQMRRTRFEILFQEYEVPYQRTFLFSFSLSYFGNICFLYFYYMHCNLCLLVLLVTMEIFDLVF